MSYTVNYENNKISSRHNIRALLTLDEDSSIRWNFLDFSLITKNNDQRMYYTEQDSNTSSRVIEFLYDENRIILHIEFYNLILKGNYIRCDNKWINTYRDDRIEFELDEILMIDEKQLKEAYSYYKTITY